MNQHLYDAPANRLIATLWQEQVALLTRRTAMARQIMQFETSLLLSFTNHYRELKTLPRRTRRGLQRQCKRSLAGVALLLSISAQPALAATINVGGACTLAKAIISANTDRGFGGCAAGRGADTIVLRRGSKHTLMGKLPVIRSSVAISGNSSTISRSGRARDFNILTVTRTGNLTLRKTTVSGGSYSGISNDGNLTLIDSTISGNFSPRNGGGLHNYGNVTIIKSAFADNYAAGGGGGIYNRGTLTVSESTISGNYAGNDGGGIDNEYATTSINNSFILDNIASLGGGIENNGGKLTISNSTISGNSSSDEDSSSGGIYAEESGFTRISGSKIIGNIGGGIYLAQTQITLINSVVSENYGEGLAGVDAYADLVNTTVSNNRGNGLSLSGELNAINSTISGNTGWGATAFGSYAQQLANSTITGNFRGGLFISGGSLTLERSLISGNGSPSGRAEVYVRNYSNVSAGNYNIFGHSGNSGASGFTPGFTDIIPYAPLRSVLNPTLSNNGGTTPTHALVAGSPAIDAVTNGTCPAPEADQRGVSRPQDGNGDGGVACDIGAFEFSAAPAQRVFCAGRPATIVGTDGDDHIIGTRGPDVIHGLNGNDRIGGLEGDDVICGGGGDDTVYGGPGNDRLLGAAGNDRLVGRDGNDVLLGYLGLDRLDGGNGRDQCNGGAPAIGDKAGDCEIVINIP